MNEVIIEMFQQFFRATKVQLLEIVVESMETVTSLVLEESEHIFPSLVSPIWAVLTKNKEEALPNAKQLTENVYKKCVDKLRSYATQAITNFDQKVAGEGSAMALQGCMGQIKLVGNIVLGNLQ